MILTKRIKESTRMTNSFVNAFLGPHKKYNKKYLELISWLVGKNLLTYSIVITTTKITKTLSEQRIEMDVPFRNLNHYYISLITPLKDFPQRLNAKVQHLNYLARNMHKDKVFKRITIWCDKDEKNCKVTTKYFLNNTHYNINLYAFRSWKDLAHSNRSFRTQDEIYRIRK